MPAAAPFRTGLCDRCAYQRRVGNTRGSSFSLCERSKTDTRYPKYPAVPVVECRGFAEAGEEGLGASERP